MKVLLVIFSLLPAWIRDSDQDTDRLLQAVVVLLLRLRFIELHTRLVGVIEGSGFAQFAI